MINFIQSIQIPVYLKPIHLYPTLCQTYPYSSISIVNYFKSLLFNPILSQFMINLLSLLTSIPVYSISVPVYNNPIFAHPRVSQFIIKQPYCIRFHPKIFLNLLIYILNYNLNIF